MTEEATLTESLPVEPPVSSFDLPPEEEFIEEELPSATDEASATPSASLAAGSIRTSGKGFNIILLAVVGAGLLGLGGIAGLYFTRPRGPA